MRLDLTDYLKYSPGYVIEIFKGDFLQYVTGNKCILPDIKKTTNDTLYDIASITKIYTATLVYIAYEEDLIDLNASVYDINQNFYNLKDVRIIDLLSHNQELWTDGYLGDATSKEQFYKILYSAYIKSNIPTYVDVHYMILSKLLETIYGMSYKDIFNKKIVEKLNLQNTTFDPDSDRTADNNYQHLNETIIDDITPGTIHDTKARVAKKLGITTGHASVFTTSHDLIVFLKTFLDCTLLKKETIDFMLKHQYFNTYEYLKKFSSKTDLNEMYDEARKNNPNFHIPKTYNNMGARYRNKIKRLNDVPYSASLKSISFSGYTGPMFTIDFERKIIVVIMCNVLHNTTLSRGERSDGIVELMNLIFDNLDKKTVD